MPLCGALFLSEVIEKPVFDPEGEILGRGKDVVVKGYPLPQLSTIITVKKEETVPDSVEGQYYFQQEKRVVIDKRRPLEPYSFSEDVLIAVR
ncbi:MAG: hypothetical protein ABR903_07405 [Thermodesulfovibrionales bacterium]|jgi:hypothetical protein